MDGMSRKFAIQLLRRLESPSQTSPTAVFLNGHDEETGEEADEPPISTPYLPATLDIPANPAQVLQHVQLIFALSAKVPDLLDESVSSYHPLLKNVAYFLLNLNFRIFFAYPRMEDSVQKAVQDHLGPVIRSIGSVPSAPAFGKILDLLRNFSPGAEALALYIIKLITEHGGRPAPPLVALLKSLIAQRNLDARFLLPIIGEIDKAEITRQIPRVVSILGSNLPGLKPGEDKTLVRSVFLTVLEKPEHGFGKVSTNLPRVRESQLLEPVKLLVMLHESSDILIKNAREGMDIRFRPFHPQIS